MELRKGKKECLLFFKPQSFLLEQILMWFFFSCHVGKGSQESVHHVHGFQLKMVDSRMLEIMSMRRLQMVPDSLCAEIVASWGTKRIAPYVI
jgi:hypothetical protein